MDQDKFDLLKSHIEAFTRKDGTVVQAHDDKRVAAAPLSAHADALARSSKPGELDHEDNQIAAGYMKAGDHKSLAGHLKNLDTAARDHILEHVHPEHREGLGFKQLDMARSKKQYDAKFGANPDKSGGGPAEGEVGHEEHKLYGKYFKKGDKVKDRYGKTHDVISHSGPEVKTSGGSFHPTKLFRQ